MPRTYGNCGPVVTARAGIEIPDPRAPRPDFDAIRARAAAVPVDQVLPVDQVHELDDDQAPVLLADQDVDQGAAVLPAAVQAGPVVCDVCGVQVAAQWVARTGQRRHKPCQSAASSAVREVA